MLSRYNEERRRRKTQSEEQTSESGATAAAIVQQGSEEGSADTAQLSGRRIVNIADFVEQIKDLDRHSPLFKCSFSNMEIISENRVGLKSALIFKCKMCNFKSTVWTEKEKNVMDVNTAAVSGTITTGGGHAQVEEFLSVLDIPPMSQKTFKKYEQKVSVGWAATAAAEMEDAAAEEARLAREHGEVDKDGTPLITVVADGAWCKRSYRTNYSSLSGVAAIVGYRTRKVVFLGVRNKYCTSCARAEATGQPSKPHACYKNWNSTQSASSMEPSIICEGFQRSEDMYGIRYARLIADGDSSVYKKILESRPYKRLTVEKVECKNHLLRNMCSRLKVIASSKTKQQSLYLRKKIGDNLLRSRVAVTKATEHRKAEDLPTSEKVENLRQDILNIPSHIFGEHKGCVERGYFCQLDKSTAPEERNLVPNLISVGLYQPIMDVFRDLSHHSRSLLVDVTSNYVEHFNSIIAKFIGGKIINFALRGSYQGRCTAAVVQHNSGAAHYKLHKNMYNASPGAFVKRTELKRKKRNERERQTKRCKKTLFVKNTNDKKDYGPASQRPDIDEALMKSESEDFLKNLRRTNEEINRIERETVQQSDSSEWLELRRNLLTASHFGRVCKMRESTGCESLVKQILYTVFDCEAMEYGRAHEETARKDLEKAIGKNIEKCGLFIDREHPFLGGSPDGLVDDDATVEIKCPSSAKTLTPDDAILKRKCTFWSVSKKGEIEEVNKNHNFYFQVQGQLRVTNRKFCFFALWTPLGIKVVKLERDETFWEEIMYPKLHKFYMNCLLPEIIDPRHSRSMPIRNPIYILEARRKSEAKKLKVSEKQIEK